ncbi:hypothetical protein [Tepidibacter formicigenes]|uniref:Uncharacterized protein n=1 Tax=Tepidibacter formicigenes DSM 15518 TaxID=1123349 RepID=A0A1M6NB48_9FIRM|nr:hypothetical protein [Tepidibacter formicigenes]SHJ92915.1 hypothetical protein SAMN02744037_01219 [Tepidibacter formicigenes DSM 15518]
MFKKGNLILKSDFDIRVIKEDDMDMDLFIDLNYRNLDIDMGKNDLNISRIQFPKVRGLVIRFSKNGYIMTCHILRDIDLHSAFANFEIDYKDSSINIINLNEKVEFFKAK